MNFWKQHRSAILRWTGYGVIVCLLASYILVEARYKAMRNQANEAIKIEYTEKEPEPPPVVSINSATAMELEQLPGIGPSYAKRIVEYREQHGPFQSVEELMNVKGIGPSKFEELKAQITL